MTTKEIQDKLVANMKTWQKIEDATVAQTSDIITKTENPVIRMVMEIIRADSQNHYRVQKLVADSLEKATTTLTPEELGDVWDMIEKHIALEKKTRDLARESLQALKGKKMVIQEYLLNYLMTDESKHNELLESLSTIKKGMYPYG